MDFWDSLNPYEGTADAGPQADGTYASPVLMPQPVDAGGGAPGNYSGAVLDVFKWGVGVWQTTQAQKDMLDYRRWEATQAGVAQQGQPAGGVRAVATGIPSGLLIGGAILLAVLLVKD